MRETLLLAGGLFAALMSAAPTKADDDIHFRPTGMEVVIHHGRDFTFRKGKNYLDQPHLMTCNSSAGCVITIQAVTNGQADAYYICGLVDGEHALPKCQLQIATDTGNSIQFAKVQKGQHTVQTKIKSPSQETLFEWAVIYTLYER